MRLAVRSAPKADETLHAFVLRLATANGHDHPGWILTAAGLGSTFATAPCDLAGLSGLTGGLATVDALARAACWDARGREGRMLLSGKPVAASALALAHARICPACVDAAGTVRALWDLRCVSACPDHDVRLTDRCPRCGRRLGWMRPGPGICPCGAPLGSGGETADPGALSVARALQAAFAGGTKEGFGPPGADLDILATLTWLVGTLGVGSTSWRSLYLSRPAVARVEEIGAAASQILGAWPLSFHRWIHAAAADGTLLGPGGILGRMRVPLAGAAMASVRREVRIALAEVSDAPTKPWARYASVGERRWLDGAEAARRLGTTQGRVTGMVAAGTLPGISRAVGSRHVHRVSADGVADMGARLAAALTTPEVALRLGVSTHAVDGLRRGGILPELRRRGRLMFDAADVEGLVAALAGSGEPDAPAGTVSLARIPRLRQRRLADVVRAVIDGHCRVHRLADGGPGAFGSLGVAPGELFGVEHRDEGEAVDVRGAARQLGLSTRMVPLLVRAGCLHGVTGARGRLARRGVQRRSLLRFPLDYVTSRGLAAHHGTNARSIGRTLHGAGVRPVVASNPRQGISDVWRRSDLERVDLGRRRMANARD